MTRFLFPALLLATLACAAPRDPAYPEPVQVRFGNLYWVGAKTLLPRVVNGQVLAPPVEACDLLGLTCELNNENLKATRQVEPFTEQTFPVSRLYNEHLPMTPLAPLAKFAGQSVSWDGRKKLAVVSGGTGSLGWRYAFPSPATAQANTYLGPLRASQTRPNTGQPDVGQIVFAEAPLKNVTFYSKVTGGLRMTGEFTPSTSDNPNRGEPCNRENPKVCELPVPRDALWTLAYLSKP